MSPALQQGRGTGVTYVSGTFLRRRDLAPRNIAEAMLSPDSAPSKPLDSASSSPSIRSISGLLVIECLFTLVGGYMDAYSYLAQGHVFANAQTGNVVFFAVYASGGEWSRALRHVPPICAFILGVAVARLLGVASEKRTFEATLTCQSIEVVVLALLGVFGARMPHGFVVPLISFAAALQNTSLSALGPWSVNNAMTTGNIRNATSGFISWLRGQERSKNRGKAIVSGLAFLCFLTGAFFGGTYTRYDEHHALVPCIAIALGGLGLTWRQRRLNRVRKQSSMLPYV